MHSAVRFVRPRAVQMRHRLPADVRCTKVHTVADGSHRRSCSPAGRPAGRAASVAALYGRFGIALESAAASVPPHRIWSDDVLAFCRRLSAVSILLSYRRVLCMRNARQTPIRTQTSTFSAGSHTFRLASDA